MKRVAVVAVLLAALSGARIVRGSWKLAYFVPGEGAAH